MLPSAPPSQPQVKVSVCPYFSPAAHSYNRTEPRLKWRSRYQQLAFAQVACRDFIMHTAHTTQTDCEQFCPLQIDPLPYSGTEIDIPPVPIGHYKVIVGRFPCRSIWIRTS